MQELIENRARTQAKRNVLGVEHSMALEDQRWAISRKRSKPRPNASSESGVAMTLFTTETAIPRCLPKNKTDLIPNLGTRDELNEWERTNILVPTTGR